MLSIASRYFIYSLGLLGLRNALKKEEDTIEVPSFRGVVEVKHKLKGRIRFYIPSLKNNAQGFDELESQLNKISGIKDTTTNPITASLLVNHDSTIEPTLIVGIIVKLLGLEDYVKKQPQSAITREFKNTQESMSLAISEKTRGVLDLKSLMFLIFTTFGVRKIMKNPDMTPAGFTLLWWGYSMIKI